MLILHDHLLILMAQYVPKNKETEADKEFELNMHDPVIWDALWKSRKYGTAAYTMPKDMPVWFWFCSGESYIVCLSYMGLICMRS